MDVPAGSPQNDDGEMHAFRVVKESGFVAAPNDIEMLSNTPLGAVRESSRLNTERPSSSL